MADQKLTQRAEISVAKDTDFIHIVQDGSSYKIQKKNLIPAQQAAPEFHGSLAIADTPTLDGYYFPSESGTYTNAGNLEVDLGTGLAIIIKKGGNYSLLYHSTGEDKVEFYNDYASFPVAGVPNVIYVDKETSNTYIWSLSLADYVLPAIGYSTDSSLHIDLETKVISANVSIYQQEFTYVASQSFTLDFEPTNFLGVYVQGVKLHSTQYTYTAPNTLTINDTLESGDVIEIIYERFIIQP